MRSEKCMEKLDWYEDNCPVDKTTMAKLRSMQEFKESHTAVLPLPNYAVEPLRTERDLEVQAEVIRTVENAVPNQRDRLYGTNSKMKQTIRRTKQKLDKEDISEDITKEPIEGKFNTILIDPPWDYGDNDNERGGTTYNTLTLEELKAIELPASDNCMLFLWTVDKFYCEAKELMKGWGFEYKTTMIWNKEWWGVGYFVRPQHEYLMLGIKGNVKPIATDIPSVFSEKKQQHSVKPEISYKLIEKMSYEPRKEIFRRREREGWK